MNKRPTLTRMDRRHTGHRYFTHYFEFYSTEFNFSEVRIWCWETWGPSTELSEWLIDASKGVTNTSHNANYCWVNDQYNKRIYFGNQAAATHFILRWL